MGKYIEIEKKISTCMGVEGVIFRVKGKEAQYIMALSSLKVFDRLPKLLPVKDWIATFYANGGIACVSFPISEEEIDRELERISFP